LHWGSVGKELQEFVVQVCLKFGLFTSSDVVDHISGFRHDYLDICRILLPILLDLSLRNIVRVILSVLAVIGPLSRRSLVGANSLAGLRPGDKFAVSLLTFRPDPFDEVIAA
jgi:hypothetical protein